jgi:hypothetical protein
MKVPRRIGRAVPARKMGHFTKVLGVWKDCTAVVLPLLWWDKLKRRNIHFCILGGVIIAFFLLVGQQLDW